MNNIICKNCLYRVSSQETDPDNDWDFKAKWVHRCTKKNEKKIQLTQKRTCYHFKVK